MDVHTRKIRHFIVVAEELHFSRAAARLFIAQQALSKQVRELEDAVGTRLFARTTRNVELTPAGEAFLAAARAAIAALDAGVDTARERAFGEVGLLKVGFVIGAALELTTPIFEEFRARHPEIELELHEFPFSDSSAGLADGQSDVALIRPPISGPAYHSEPLFTEPRVVGVASTHHLAGRTSVSVRELLDEPIVIGRSADAVWRGYWMLDDYRDGQPPKKVIETASHTEEVALVAAGVACTITVAGAARYTPHPGVRYLPITDIPGSVLAAAWSSGHHSPVRERFVDVARAVRDRDTELLKTIEQPYGP